MSQAARAKSSTQEVPIQSDYLVIEMNRHAYARLRSEKEIEIVPGATHLFEEPGTLDQAAHLAADWFQTHLANRRRARVKVRRDRVNIQSQTLRH